jgi:hypothetical protein
MFSHKFFPSVGLFLVLSLSSCTKYQFFSVNSYDFPAETKVLMDDNDSLRITYAFTGPDGQFVINFLNKSDKPMYVDWSRSAIVVNGYKTNMFNTTGNFQGEMYAETFYPFEHIGITRGVFQGGIQTTESTRFIPPGATLQSVQTPIAVQMYPAEVVDAHFQREKVKGKLNENFSVRRLSFTPDKSPVRMRTYITVYSEQNAAQPQRFEHSFWISEVVHTLNPNLYENAAEQTPQPIDTRRDNKLAVARPTAFNGFASVVGVVGTLVGLGWLASQTDSN